MGYFDGSYFDATYFDCGTPVAVGGGHGKWLRRQHIEAPPIPAWLAIAERKRRRQEEETLADILRRQREARRRLLARSLVLGLD